MYSLPLAFNSMILYLGAYQDVEKQDPFLREDRGKKNRPLLVNPARESTGSTSPNIMGEIILLNNVPTDFKEDGRCTPCWCHAIDIISANIPPIS